MERVLIAAAMLALHAAAPAQLAPMPGGAGGPLGRPGSLQAGTGNTPPRPPSQTADGRPPRLRSLMMPYFDYEPMADIVVIDTPVLGFGNEALWEDLDERAIRIASRTSHRVAAQK